MDYFALANLGLKACSSIRATRYANLAKDMAGPISLLFLSGIVDHALTDFVNEVAIPKLVKQLEKVDNNV